MPQVYIPTELRWLVRERASEACEYCRVREVFSFFVHEVDHIVARQHGGETVETNLALACIFCNKLKGTNLSSVDPANGEVARLFHPRRDVWHQHFVLRDEFIEPLTAEGRATARLLQFNTETRRMERQVLILAGGLLP